jgi:NitT/TauT family transport system ATP-binding protein
MAATSIDTSPASGPAANGRSSHVDAPPAPTVLSVSGLSKTYATAGGPALAISDVSFELRAGEFVSIVGPSGCGKSTLLNCVSGLLDPTTGDVLVDGRPVRGGPPENMSIVFQDYSRSLFQWFSVEKNVALPLLHSRMSRAEQREQVRRMLADVHLPEGVHKRYPWQLSGGMQQRVAIARSLVSHPEILLMDEPFASVDAQTRMSLEDLVLELWAAWHKSILFVTHDIDEAVYLSDRVIVLSKGPSMVKAVIDIPLPRPRQQLETKRMPEFASLRSSILELVLDQPAGQADVDADGSPAPMLDAQ